MPYVKRIVCLANSFKPGGTCLAGKEVLPGGYGEWLRPVSDRPGEELSWNEARYKNRQQPQLLDVVDVPLLTSTHTGTHQVENVLFDASRRCAHAGRIPFADLPLLCDQPETLWVNGAHTFGGLNNCVRREEARGLRSSLTLIRPETFAVIVGSDDREGWKRATWWGRFEYRRVSYIMRITDPIIRTKYGTVKEGEYPLENVFVSVSLTNPYAVDGRCHKLAAAIFIG